MKHRLEDHDSISSAEISGLREIGGLRCLVTYFFESQVLAKLNHRDDKTQRSIREWGVSTLMLYDSLNATSCHRLVFKNNGSHHPSYFAISLLLLLRYHHLKQKNHTCATFSHIFVALSPLDQDSKFSNLTHDQGCAAVAQIRSRMMILLIIFLVVVVAGLPMVATKHHEEWPITLVANQDLMPMAKRSGFPTKPAPGVILYGKTRKATHNAAPSSIMAPSIMAPSITPRCLKTIMAIVRAVIVVKRKDLQHMRMNTVQAVTNLVHQAQLDARLDH